MMIWLKTLMPLILVNLLRKTDYGHKVSGFEGKTPNITTDIATTTTALTTVENKTPSVIEFGKNNYSITLL